MKKLAKKCNHLEEILDSDDELPSDYIEIPFVPAYKDDNRFEYIEKQTRINKELSNKGNITANSSHSTCNEIARMKPRKFKTGETVLLKGYLTKKDTFCFQCLESTTNKKTLLWFFNFLTLKDLQSNYKFLITCLVPNYDHYYSYADNEYYINIRKAMV